MAKQMNLPNAGKSGEWLWQLGIVVPGDQAVEYPVCPFCTASPFREPEESLPATCPVCGAHLKADTMLPGTGENE